MYVMVKVKSVDPRVAAVGSGSQDQFAGPQTGGRQQAVGPESSQSREGTT